MRRASSMFVLGILAIAAACIGIQNPSIAGYGTCVKTYIINTDCPTGCAYEPKWCEEARGCEFYNESSEYCVPRPPDSGTGTRSYGFRYTTENRYSGPYCTYDMSRTTIDTGTECRCCKPTSIGV